MRHKHCKTSQVEQIYVNLLKAILDDCLAAWLCFLNEPSIEVVNKPLLRQVVINFTTGYYGIHL